MQSPDQPHSTPPKPPRLFVGVMSGTSLDGLDAAAVRVDLNAPRPHFLAGRSAAFPRELKDELRTIRTEGAVSLSGCARITRDLTLLYACVVRELLDVVRLRSDVSAVGVHGQTVFHAPPLTTQWFDPSLLAYEIGLPVISDFRRADCAAGGQGAPLVPLGDYAFFRDPDRSRAVVNVGGIANVTYLPAGCATADVLAFDTGPGNVVLDALAVAADPDGPGYDVGGRRSAAGRVAGDFLARLLDTDYHRRPFPKSTDGPEMLAAWQAVVPRDLPTDDAFATAAAWTARSVLDALDRLGGRVDEIVVAGGGVHNVAVMDALRRSGGPVVTTDALGVPSAYREAAAFAVLAAATLDRKAGNLPTATGATRPVVLGSVTEIRPLAENP